MRSLYGCFVVFAFLLTVVPLPAAGLGFEYQSAKASSRGNAMVASLDSASIVHYNPGGLALLDDREVELNVFSINANLTLKNTAGEFSPSDETLFSGSAFIALPVKHRGRRYGFGFGVTAPYGQSTSWDAGVPFRNAGYEATLRYYQLHIAASAEILPGLGIGASLIVADSKFQSSGGLALPTDRLKFDGGDTSLAYQLGIHHRVNDFWSWGLSYRSGVRLKHRGDYNYESGNPFVPGFENEGEASFDLPSHITLGCELRPTDAWQVALQVQWTKWSTVDTFEANIGGVIQQQPARWNDSLIYSLGVSYQCCLGTQLHAGYMYVAPLIDDAFSQALLADLDQHFLSVGITQEIGNWSVDAAFVYVISKDNEVKGSIYGADGDYSSEGWFFNVGLGVKF